MPAGAASSVVTSAALAPGTEGRLGWDAVIPAPRQQKAHALQLPFSGDAGVAGFGFVAWCKASSTAGPLTAEGLAARA